MHYKEKKKLKELLQAVIEGLTGKDLTRINHKAFNHIKESISLVKEILEKEQVYPSKTLDKLTTLQEALDDRYSLEELQEHCNSLMRSFEDEVEGRYKVVFFPYKASMWDSLESIYFAARDDDLCDAEVVPIPYYKLSEDNAEITYEGSLFPPGIQITHYSAYDLRVERPDIIFVHNIYDQYNAVTRVHEEYFTSNLRKYTDLLVYVPYCLFSFVPPKLGGVSTGIAFGLPSIKNVDKVVVQGRHYTDAALALGLPKEKILPLGSPKVDRLVVAFEEGLSLPEPWHEKIRDKTVFLFDTHMLFLSSGNPFYRLELLVKILNTPNFIDNSVLIWRPHPLLIAALRQTSPLLLEYYLDLVDRMGEKEYSNVIYDDSPDFLPALVAADIYIGTSSSLLNGFLLKGKPVILASEFPPGWDSKEELFYSLVVPDSAWIDVLSDAVSRAHTRESQEPTTVRDAWYNVDGTSGEKVYRATREQILMDLWNCKS